MQSHEAYLKRAIELSVKSRESGNTPFAALLVDKDGNIIMEQMNNEITEHKCTGHAETQLVERASHAYSKEFLWDCTLYTTAEPCAHVFRCHLLGQHRPCCVCHDREGSALPDRCRSSEPDLRSALPRRLRQRSEGHRSHRPIP